VEIPQLHIYLRMPQPLAAVVAPAPYRLAPLPPRTTMVSRFQTWWRSDMHS
jgi:hypothetical protein